MSYQLSLAVNLNMCPGVTSSGLEQLPDGTVVVTVHGGNPVTVANMILACLPPGTPTGGETLVSVGDLVVRLNHVDPTLEHPEDYVAPLPLKTPEGLHEPMGEKPTELKTQFQFSTFELVALMGLVALLVVGALVWWG